MRREGSPRRVFWVSPMTGWTEVCAVRRLPRGWVLEGAVVGSSDSAGATVAYRIQTDLLWRTRRVEVDQQAGQAHAALDIRARGGHWTVGGERHGDLDGCLDVDLEVSPVTNTLPIRRQRVKLGGTVRVKVARVRFPSLEVRTLEQSYERVGADRYVYRSATGFEAELEVDGFGLVMKYGKYWSAA